VRYLWICVLITLAPLYARAATAADVTFPQIAGITNDRIADLQKLGVLLHSTPIWSSHIYQTGYLEHAKTAAPG
jgi:hypothetical protein